MSVISPPICPQSHSGSNNNVQGCLHLHLGACNTYHFALLQLHYCMQPLGFRGSLSLNSKQKREATGYRYLVLLCAPTGRKHRTRKIIPWKNKGRGTHLISRIMCHVYGQHYVYCVLKQTRIKMPTSVPRNVEFCNHCQFCLRLCASFFFQDSSAMWKDREVLKYFSFQRAQFMVEERCQCNSPL